MKITVCIGSSCHLKGSRQVVEELHRLIKEHNVESKIELSGTFCMGKCQEGVCVTVDGKQYSFNPANTKTIFETELLPQLA